MDSASITLLSIGCRLRGNDGFTDVVLISVIPAKAGIYAEIAGVNYLMHQHV
jgi:hypothetical protein